VFAQAGWRIQQNAMTGHFRLLDPDDKRLEWGSYAACLESFKSISQQNAANWSGSHLVIMIHGLGRSRKSFAKLAGALQNEGYATLSISYASTRGDPIEHAVRLNHLLSNLQGIATVSFVSHSYGGLVLRQTLAVNCDWRSRIDVHRAVLLAPPSKGSAIADALKDIPAYGLVLGKGGQAVTAQEAVMVPPPNVQFGIIAGGRKDGHGFNPLLKGDDDGVVTVEETKLEGAADFLVVDALHTFIMDNPASIAAIIHFLKTGAFQP
jgi:pimeloyl-ACP methyl ester carboxylesterase